MIDEQTIWMKLAGNLSIDTSGIVVEVQDGKVTLRGQVAERVEKRLAESLIRNVEGVTEVENLLQVAMAHDTSPTLTREAELTRL